MLASKQSSSIVSRVICVLTCLAQRSSFDVLDMYSSLNKTDIKAALKQLNLPIGEYAVVGSAVMTMHGLRPAGDIDLIVSERVYKQLKANGWREKLREGTHGRPQSLYEDVFDAGMAWGVGAYHPSPQELIDNAQIIEGVPCVSLTAVRDWKKECGREKDLVDVALIDEYLVK
jgi:hypothetical protein